MATALFEIAQWRFWPRSLRWQLQMWQAFLFTCMLIAFGVAAYELVDAYRFYQTDADLQMRVGALRKIISEGRRREEPPKRRLPPERRHISPRRGHRAPGPPDGPPPEWLGPPPGEPFADGHLPPDFAISSETAALFGPVTGFYFVIWSRDGQVLRQSQSVPKGTPAPTAAERDSLGHTRNWATYRELIHCSGPGDCVVAGRSVAADLRNATVIAWLIPLAGGTVLLIGLTVGWWLITRAVRPVAQIRAAAAEISRGNLAARVPVSDPHNELGQLSAALNATFAVLEADFERQQQFTSDAAHELRTPLAIMISEAQTALARPRSAGEYKRALEDCLETAQQMRRLTDTLLDLARLEVGNAGSQRTEIDLAEITMRCISQLEPLASRFQITLKHDLAEARMLNLSDRIVLVAMNLLVNAISYNRPGGEVFVRTGSDGDYNTLSVADTGIGIGLTDLPRIFDRFYRADKVRTRAGGHAGLGLSICKAILDAEGGTIHVRSEIGKGSVFIVQLPVISSL